MNWHVIYTGINQEFLAEQGLKNLFETYCPVGRKIIKHARQRTVKHVPVFSRYIFVRFDAEDGDHRNAIRSTDGIIDILANNFKPIEVHPEIIDHIRERQLSGEFDQKQPKKERRWSRGFEMLERLLNPELAIA